MSQRLSYQKQYSSLWRLRSIVVVFAYHDKIQTDIYICIHAHISSQTPLCFKRWYGCVGYCGKRYGDAMMACTCGHVYIHTHLLTPEFMCAYVYAHSVWIHIYIHTYITLLHLLLSPLDERTSLIITPSPVTQSLPLSSAFSVMH